MKRFYIFILLAGTVYSATAQQLATSSLYDMQGMLHNPAMAGTDKHAVIGAGFRSMWSGIDGGPQTTTVFGSTYLSNIKLGLGGYIFNDVTGPTKRTGLQMAYAYHINMKNGGTFSLGLEARLQQFSYDKEKIQAALGNDPVLAGDASQFKGDAGFGIAYTSSKWKLGVSASQLLQSKLNFYSGTLNRSAEGRLYRHYYFHGAYSWKVDESSRITPNALVIYMPNAPVEVQAGVKFDYKDLIWWSASLRARQSWMFSGGVKIQKKFSIGYGFDLYQTPLSTFDQGGGAHEVMLRYDFIK